MADIASYRTLVQKFYVAYFGRPADPGGMDNMASALAAAGAPTDAKGCLTAYASNSTIRSIVDSFGTSDESKALYPGDTAAFLGAIYRNLFGRAPGSEGLAFWTGAIDRGEVVRGQAALNILVGAESNTSALGLLDAASISNKVKIASTFTDSVVTPTLVAGYAGKGAAAAARTLLGAVNGSTDVLNYLPAVQAALSSMSVASPASPDLLAADDTGWSSADNITRQTTGLSFIGLAPGAATVALYDNGGTTPIGSAAVVKGRYSIDVSLTPGLHLLTARSTGSGGSSSTASAGLEVIVDATAPPVPVAVLQTDSGVAGDGLTNNGQLSVTGIETGARLEYRVNAGNWLPSPGYLDGTNVVEVRQVDAAGLESAASNRISFTLDRSGPAIVGGTPASQGIEFPVAATLALEFSETLTKGSGYIVLRDHTGVSHSFAIDDASQVTVSGKTVAIKPTAPLLANRQYVLTFDSGTLVDAAGNGLLSTAAGSSIRFATSDTLAPTLLSSLPADNAVDVAAGTNIVLSFSEALKAGSGNIILSAGVADVRIISVTDTSMVTINGATVTIKPGAPLDGSRTYSVTMQAGVLKDLAGNAFDGISMAKAVDFSTLSTNGAFKLATLSADRGFRIDGTSTLHSVGSASYRLSDKIGATVGRAGDFNADGFDDVLIGPGGSRFAYILYGSASPAAVNMAALNGSNGMRLNWIADWDGGSASSLQGLGDVNGDGIADVAVGTNGTNGVGYVLYGKAASSAADTDLEKLATSAGYRFEDMRGMTFAAKDVADAGDINGDGLHDVIFGVSGPSYSGMTKLSDSLPGSAFVIVGKKDFKMPSYVALGEKEGYWFNGTGPMDYTGYGVAGAGDFNRDGYDDFLIGSIYANGKTGKAQLVFGKAAPFAAQVSLGSQGSSDAVAIIGDLADDSLGYSVAGVGDFNGDGYADFAVSLRGAAPSGVRGDTWMVDVKGAVVLIYGHANDGTASLTLAALNGSNGVRFNGHAFGDYAGYSIGAAGDVNGDGYDDLIIGAPGDGLDANGKAEGATYVVFGTGKTLAAQIDLSKLDRTNSIRFDGAVAGDRAGTAVSSAGDFNGDGYGDLIIGAPDALLGGGSAYIVYGRDFNGTVDFTGTAGADIWRGTNGAQEAVGGIGNDSLSGGGGADVLYGGAGNDKLQVDDLAFRRIDGGNGTDTLSLGGAGMNLNLAQYRNQISGIEVIDLTGTGNNSLTLLARDLLNLSDTGNQLRVDGNAGDAVALGSGWSDGGIANGYHTYSLGQAVILVGTALTVTF